MLGISPALGTPSNERHWNQQRSPTAYGDVQSSNLLVPIPCLIVGLPYDRKQRLRCPMRHGITGLLCVAGLVEQDAVHGDGNGIRIHTTTSSLVTLHPNRHWRGQYSESPSPRSQSAPIVSGSCIIKHDPILCRTGSPTVGIVGFGEILPVASMFSCESAHDMGVCRAASIRQHYEDLQGGPVSL